MTIFLLVCVVGLTVALWQQNRAWSKACDKGDGQLRCMGEALMKMRDLLLARAGLSETAAEEVESLVDKALFMEDCPRRNDEVLGLLDRAVEITRYDQG